MQIFQGKIKPKALGQIISSIPSCSSSEQTDLQAWTTCKVKNLKYFLRFIVRVEHSKKEAS